MSIYKYFHDSANQQLSLPVMAGWIWLVGCYYSVARVRVSVLSLVRVLVTADFIETKTNKPNIFVKFKRGVRLKI